MGILLVIHNRPTFYDHDQSLASTDRNIVSDRKEVPSLKFLTFMMINYDAPFQLGYNAIPSPPQFIGIMYHPVMNIPFKSSDQSLVN